MWADDFWGSDAWSHWERELRKVLPASEYPIIDVPMNHSIFHTLFDSSGSRRSRRSRGPTAARRPSAAPTAQPPTRARSSIPRAA